MKRNIRTAIASYPGAETKKAKLELVPPPKVLVNFRPHTNYNGEYGFDWVRMGDTGRDGDVRYKDIIGLYIDDFFIPNDREYTDLCEDYEMSNHPIEENDKYIVPVLALLPTKKAKFSLHVEVAIEATKIAFNYNKTFFNLNQTEVSK